jgi:serine/threonine protein kinase/Flp pilus assembly protein TadD/WD40 repeat protein
MSKIRIFGVKLRQVALLLSVADEQVDASHPTQQSLSDAHDSDPGQEGSFRTGKDAPQAKEVSIPITLPDRSLEQPGSWIGRYKLLSLLGEGGMGVVYLAEQHHPFRRQVALKIIKPGMDSKRVIARFEAEQQALALSEHPYVARIHDAGLTQSGRPYFVMEHVNGVPITRYCDDHKLTIEERLLLFLHVCEAIHHAHQKGIIHRDIKPFNILVTGSDSEVVPKVIDFGVARALSLPLTERTLYTEQGQLVGTPEYMSPEQVDLDNQDIDTRTDIYSLGVLLYELLTGVLPFDRRTFREGGVEHIRKVLCEQDPNTPSIRLSRSSKEESTELARKRRTDSPTLQRKLRGDLDWITLKAMEKDRTRRYAGVDAMATDIRNYLNHQPVTAAPPGIVYQARKFLRRHRQAAIVFTMTALMLIGGTSALLMYGRAARERNYAESLEHQGLLAEAQALASSNRSEEVLVRIAPLLNSPHVKRQAKLLQVQLLLEQQGAGAAVPLLKQLLGTPDEVAGKAHFLLANIYYNGDPSAPGSTAEYCQRWRHHRQQAELLIADTASYYFLRAQAAYRVKEMLAMLAKALRLDKQHYDSLRERAHIYYSQHDYEKTARDATRMIGIRPDCPQGYALSALALREMGRFDEALQDHNEAIQLAPDDPELYDARSKTYTRLGEYELALRDAQTCVQLRPDDLPSRHQLFAAYTALGRYDEAEREYAHFMSYPTLRDHHPGSPAQNLRDIFQLYSLKLVAKSLADGRSWYGSVKAPRTAPYCLMYNIDPLYRALQARGKCLVSKGFHPSWSPDGTKLAYSHGLLRASGVAVLDTATGQTELLTTSGRNPEWSPDSRYIAFERNRRIWPIDSLAKLDIRTWRPTGWRQTHAPEVWLVDMETDEIRRVAEGTCPRWGHQSGRLYYISRQDNTLYSVSSANSDAKPVEVLSDCACSAVVSPNERYVADQNSRELKIIDLSSKGVTATWIAPPAPLGDLQVSWSPDSRELSIGSGEIGLWIYDIETSVASKVLDGRWMTSCWSRDGSKLALALLGPLEIWQVDLEPGVPTVASFDSVQTIEEHCLDLMAYVNQTIAMDPAYMRAHYIRANCALWMGHEKADEYLQQFEQVLPPYNATDCEREARWMLNATPELRDRLLPLARLLARKAVEKEPENVDFLKTLGEALYHSEDRENAEETLRRAFDLSLAGSDLDDPQTSEVIQLLIRLYESWGKPEEADRWRAKLPQETGTKE